MFFGSSSISGSITKIYLHRIRQYYGSSDLVIHAGEKSLTRLLSKNNAENLSGEFEYIIESFESTASYNPKINETNSVYLRGCDFDDLQKINPVNIISKYDHLPFNERKIIINSVTAEKFRLGLNDSIDLELNGKKQKFRIAAIAEPAGPLQNEGSNIVCIVPIETLRLLNDARGKGTIIFLKLKDVKQKEAVKAELQRLYPRYTVREPFNDGDIKRYTSQISTPFMMMTALVLFISIFIIYSSFKVITMERLPVIGTFRSIGATKKTTDFVLFIESITYGIIGGVIGCLAGIGILYIMTAVMANNPWDNVKSKIEIDFSFMQIVISFMVALVLSFASSLVPIIKVSKIPVKDLVLNKIEKDVKTRSWRIYTGIVLLFISVSLQFVVPHRLGIIVGTSCMIMSVVAVILIVPAVTGMFIKIFQTVYSRSLGNEGVIASKNLRGNKNILNNISLLAIGISSLLMINTVSYSVVGEMTNFYRSAKFDVWMWYYMADRDLIGRLRFTGGIKDACGTYALHNIEIDKNFYNPVGNRSGGKGENRINLIHGINREKFFDFWRIKIDKDKLDELDSGRNILCTYFLKGKFALKEGDMISLKLNKTDKTYRVIGFFSSLRDSGNYAIISERFLKLDSLSKYYEEIYIKTSIDPDAAEKILREKFGKNRPWICTVRQMEQNERKSNEQLFTILRGFSILTMIIGIFGILNNFIIGFIQRKRHLAIYRSVGMSRKQIVKMVFIEALTGGLIGGIMGISSGVILINIVGFVIKGMNLFVPIRYSPMLFLYSLLAGIIVTVIASISPAVKSSKLNIIEAVKYE